MSVSFNKDFVINKSLIIVSKNLFFPDKNIHNLLPIVFTDMWAVKRPSFTCVPFYCLVSLNITTFTVAETIRIKTRCCIGAHNWI